MSSASPSSPISAAEAQELAVALHDLAWALPRTVDAQVEAELEPAELEPLPPSELEVMRQLDRQPGLSLGEVADELGLQASNASATVRSLALRGLVERRPDDTDRRVTRLFPTDEASRTRKVRERAWGQRLKHELDGLTPEQAHALTAAIPALRALAAQLGSPE